jgi:hypothetical protein
MSELAQQQQALLAALWDSRHEDAAARLPGFAEQGAQAVRGLRAYRTNGRELAARALAGAYPVVAQLLGEDNFRALARSLWLAQPPQRGDMAQWGGELATHIESLPELAEAEPYLADVARVEWALHRAATAADAEPDFASFQLLAQLDPAQLALRLAPGTALLSSPWPAASIVLAHLQGEPSLQQAGELLRGRVAETALVWRQGLKPGLRGLAAPEAVFLAALQDRRSLADSLQAAPELNFNEWLAPAVQSGLVTGAEPA